MPLPDPIRRRSLAAAAAPLAEMVKRQVFSMRRQVDHYLARARAAGSLDVLGNRTQISAVMDDLSRVIARIHTVRGIVIDAECDDGLYFRGERQDLEEMLGNLIDLQFGQGKNWPLGSALSITLLVIVTVALLVYVRNASQSGANHGH